MTSIQYIRCDSALCWERIPDHLISRRPVISQLFVAYSKGSKASLVGRNDFYLGGEICQRHNIVSIFESYSEYKYQFTLPTKTASIG